MPDSLLLARVLALGAVTGMRSLLGLALFAWFGGSSHGLGNWFAKGALALGAAGELVIDKLPGAPSRLRAGPLVSRLILGAVCGIQLSLRDGGSPPLLAACGALSAAGGAVAGNRLRAALVRRTGWPDGWFAILEDLLAIGIGVWAVI